MRTGKYIVMMLMLLMCGAGEVWADDITVYVEKSDGSSQTITGSGGSVNTGITGGSISVAISGREVTLTIKPAANYFIKASEIVVEPLVSTDSNSGIFNNSKYIEK